MLTTSDFRSSILVSFARLFANPLSFPSLLSSGLGDPHGVGRQGDLNLFCALTCAVGYAGEVLEFDVIKVAREVLSARWRAFTAELSPDLSACNQ